MDKSLVKSKKVIFEYLSLTSMKKNCLLIPTCFLPLDILHQSTQTISTVRRFKMIINF
jgi:hypothetical protein